MITFETDIFMAVTVVLIGVILTVYLSILKRNGWIGKTSNYRCPNPQCKKVFQKPIKVKNQSNQKEIHLACPECGYDLGSSNNKNALKERMIENKSEPKTSESPNALIENKVSVIKVSKESETVEKNHPSVELNQGRSAQATTAMSLEESASKSSQNIEKEQVTERIENKVTTIKDTAKESKSLENSPQTLESKHDLKPPRTNNKLTLKQTENDKRKDRPEGCNHHFGYLATLPKNTGTPDECYSCPKLIDCFK
ncbi:MAG: hypothetical protein ABSA79_02330 [Candidatus Bathyarchaeia archaeon]